MCVCERERERRWGGKERQGDRDLESKRQVTLIRKKEERQETSYCY